MPDEKNNSNGKPLLNTYRLHELENDELLHLDTFEKLPDFEHRALFEFIEYLRGNGILILHRLKIVAVSQKACKLLMTDEVGILGRHIDELSFTTEHKFLDNASVEINSPISAKIPGKDGKTVNLTIRLASAGKGSLSQIVIIGENTG